MSEIQTGPANNFVGLITCGGCEHLGEIHPTGRCIHISRAEARWNKEKKPDQPSTKQALRVRSISS
jgi:hypothetical protein